MSRYKRRFEVAEQIVEGPGQRFPPRDENIVIAGPAIKGKQLLRRRLESAPGAVSRYGIADFATCSETYSNCRGCLFWSEAKLDCKSWSDAPDAARGAQEISSLLEAFDIGLRFAEV